MHVLYIHFNLGLQINVCKTKNIGLIFIFKASAFFLIFCIYEILHILVIGIQLIANILYLYVYMFFIKTFLMYSIYFEVLYSSFSNIVDYFFI